MVCALATSQRPVGEGDRAGFGEQADLGDLRPCEALGQRGGRQHPHLGGVAGAPQDEVDHRGVVDRRIGVGPRDQRRHAAGRRRRAGGGDGLAMLGAGFADEGAHVDQAGSDDVAAAVDDLRVGAAAASRLTAGPSAAILPSTTRAPPRDPRGGRIDQPGVEKGDRAGLRHGNGISGQRRAGKGRRRLREARLSLRFALVWPVKTG